MFHFAIALNVILSTSEVPHEVAPVHEIHLIREEESEVVHLCGHFSSEAIRLSLIFSRNIYSLRFHTTEPFVVEAGVLARVHAWEEHLLCAGEHGLCRHLHHIIAVRFVSVLLFVALHCLFLRISKRLRGVGFAVEQRFRTVLLTVEISAEGENVLRRVLVHGRVRHGADDDYRISGVANHEHEHAQERGVECAFAYHVFSIALPEEECTKERQHHSSNEERTCDAFAIEGDTQHGNTRKVERNGGSAVVLCGAPNGSTYHTDEGKDVNHQTGVER